jgi:hypothetical protein
VAQNELVGGAETEHDERVPVQAIANPAPEAECLKFTHCQRVDVANSPSVQMAAVCMMNGMCATPVVVRRQRQDTKKPSHPVVCQTIAKEGTMSAIMLDHE